MQIKQAEYVISSTNYKKCPAADRPEFAFIGRSNVGKSSLINMLTGRKKLALTSSKPGKTKLINHFLINDQWYLVDLPGYGWAKTGKKHKKEWEKMIREYILKRSNLLSLFMLVDGCLPPQKNDLQFIYWLGSNGIPFAIVFTKTDKISNQRIRKNLEEFDRQLLESWETLPPSFVSSIKTKNGRKEILDYIREALLEFENFDVK